MNPKNLARTACLGLLVFALACGSTAYHRGMVALDKGDVDAAVKNFDLAVKENPRNVKYKTNMVRAHLKAESRHMALAEVALARNDYKVAAEELTLVLRSNPHNQYAKDTLDKVLAAAAAKEEADRRANTTIDELKKESQNDMGVPQLDPASNIPIVLKFTDTPVKTILDAVSKASGINFLYDEKADLNKRVTVDFAKVDLAQVMDYLMMQSKHFFKVLDPHTLIIVPDTKQKRDEYTDQVIRTFYLSNADAKDVFQLVRSILQTRKMAMNQDLNSITIQDSPEVVAIAQHIIEDNDKSKGEVVVDVELLEVDRNMERDLGINLAGTLPNNSFTIGPAHNLTKDSSGNVTGIGSGPPIPINELGRTLSHGLYIYPIPNLTATLLLQSGSGQVLANPQLRVMEGQKASVHIGDKYPIPTANTYATTTTTTNYTPITSYTYQDIGVKIEIEPKVHHNREITIKLKVEISSLGPPVKGTGNNPDQPVIQTRESNSVIRLEDGETSLMAGLISKNESTSLSGLPGISEIPILRRLFSSTSNTNKTTDVVMLLTPHIIRMPNITEADLKPLWVGTADNPKLGGEAGSSWGPSPFSPVRGQPAAAKPKPEDKGQAVPDAKSQGMGQAGPDAKASNSASAPAEDSGTSTAMAGTSVRLMLSPTNLTVKPGATVLLNLVAVGAQDVKNMHLEMDYPNGVLKFQGADEGTFLKLGGTGTSFVADERRPGFAVMDTGRASGGAAGSGLLARVRFTAVKPGQAKINFGVATATGSTGISATLPPMSATVTVADDAGAAPAVPAVPAAKAASTGGSGD